MLPGCIILILTWHTWACNVKDILIGHHSKFKTNSYMLTYLSESTTLAMSPQILDRIWYYPQQ